MKMRQVRIRFIGWVCLCSVLATLAPDGVFAQETEPGGVLRVVTVERQPFAMRIDSQLQGFSVDLLRILSERLGWRYQLMAEPSFERMLDRVAQGEAGLAVGNISITSAREARFDFSHPVFDAGLQILVPVEADSGSVFSAIFTWEMAAWVGSAVAVIFVIGNLMWFFERRHSDYFQGAYRERMWPSFWYTLQAMINGGFEQPVPRSLPARLLGIVLVLCSLFVVSAFVATSSSTMTVNELRSDIQGYGDLYGKRVGTTRGSTAATFLSTHGIHYTGYDDVATLFDALLAKQLDAVVHDAPVLRYFAATGGRRRTTVVGPIFKPEKYGILFPQGSARVESLNRELLHLREDGTYQQIYLRWFGNDRHLE